METFKNSWKGEINDNAVSKVRVMHFNKSLPPSKAKSDIEVQFLVVEWKEKINQHINQAWLQRSCIIVEFFS